MGGVQTFGLLVEFMAERAAVFVWYEEASLVTWMSWGDTWQTAAT